MSRRLGFIAVCVALSAISRAAPRAQATRGEQPPETAARAEQEAKPAEQQARPADQQAKPAAAQAAPGEIAPEDYPPDFKAFNAAAAEKDAAKRMEALQRFVADNPKSVLATQARMMVQSYLLTTLRDSQKKYLDLANAQIDAVKTAGGPAAPPEFMAYSTYNRLAGELLRNGVLLEEAEKFSRTGLSMMDEQKYLAYRKQAAERAAAARKEREANASAASAAAPPTGAPPTPAAAPTPPVMGFSTSMKDGVMVARPMGPRPPSGAAASPTPPPPTDQEILASFRADKAGAQATLGQILVKRGKTEEGEKLLKDAYAAHPASSTMAVIAKLLAESARKAGDTGAQIEYLTTLALSGRMTAEERQDLEAAYGKAHNGSLDGLEDMLDARYRRDMPTLELTPFTRKPAANGEPVRAVLAEMFTGAG